MIIFERPGEEAAPFWRSVPFYRPSYLLCMTSYVYLLWNREKWKKGLLVIQIVAFFLTMSKVCSLVAFPSHSAWLRVFWFRKSKFCIQFRDGPVKRAVPFPSKNDWGFLPEVKQILSITNRETNFYPFQEGSICVVLDVWIRSLLYLPYFTSTAADRN